MREAYMRRRIEETIAAGHKPEKIVAVVGAFHAPVLSGEFPAMTDDELASLPQALEQAHADAVFVLQALVAIGLRRRQPRAGLFRAALGGARTSAASTTCRCATCRSSPATCARPARIAPRPK